MKKKILLIVIALMTVSGNVVITAQEDIYDVLTLKDGKGVIKGFIKEQVYGKSISIVPSEAILKIDSKDSDVISGEVLETAPGKWKLIRTKNLSERTYPLSDIAKIGKAFSDSLKNVFEAYGVLDVLELKDGTVKGVIIEQVFGQTVKIKTVDKGVLVYDLSEIVSAKKEAYEPSKDIFTQSSYLDVLTLKNNSVLSGIITQQVFGKRIDIAMVGDSKFVVKYDDVVKLVKRKNPSKVAKEEPIEVVKEPEFLGDCFLMSSADQSVPLEKQEYARGRKTSSLFLINGDQTSPVHIPIDSVARVMVRVANNDVAPEQQIYVIKLDYNKATKKREINTKLYPFLNPDAEVKEVEVITYNAERKGESSFLLTFTPTIVGEYAIYVTGCDQTFSLFSVEAHKE